MKKIKLYQILKQLTDSPHHVAAIHILEEAMPDELLDRHCEWIECFNAESEPHPQEAKYNTSSK